jgi:hypothetical protein
VGIESILRYRTQTRAVEEHPRLDMDLGQQDRCLAIVSFVIFTFLFVTKHKVLFARFPSYLASSANQSSRRDQSESWTLHGAQYDLYDFMDRHSGGKEAIELGKGRDCTALFESYPTPSPAILGKRHPLNDLRLPQLQHCLTQFLFRLVYFRLLLQKFQVSHRCPTGQVEHEKESFSDPFYDLLKRRVATALMQHGMDLKKDRCAPSIRVAYYMLIAFCLAISAAASTRQGT